MLAHLPPLMMPLPIEESASEGSLIELVELVVIVNCLHEGIAVANVEICWAKMRQARSSATLEMRTMLSWNLALETEMVLCSEEGNPMVVP